MNKADILKLTRRGIPITRDADVPKYYYVPRITYYYGIRFKRTWPFIKFKRLMDFE